MSTSGTSAPAAKSGFLINRNFAALWAGQSISFIGDALLDFTLALWVVFDLGRGQSWAPLAVGGVMISASLGTLLIGPLAGVFVDRWDKRRTMLGGVIAQGVLTAALLLIADVVPLPFFPGGHPTLTVQLSALFAVNFVVFGCAQFTRSARAALIGDIVSEPDLPKASGLIETMASLAMLIGYGAAPLVFVPFGIGFALIADTCSFVVAFVALLVVSAPPAAHSVADGEHGSVGREFLAGLRFAFGNSIIRTLLISLMIVLFGSGAINSLYIFFLTKDLHASPDAVGAFPVVLGVGLVIGSVVGGAFARRIGLGRIFWISMVLIGILAIVLSRQTAYIPGLVVAFLLGIPNGLLNVPLMPLVLHATPRAMIGRVMTIIEPSITVAQIISVSVFGTLAGTVLSNLDVHVLGQSFDTYSLLILIPGVLSLVAAVIAFGGLRGVKVSSAETNEATEVAPPEVLVGIAQPPLEV